VAKFKRNGTAPSRLGAKVSDHECTTTYRPSGACLFPSRINSGFHCLAITLTISSASSSFAESPGGTSSQLQLVSPGITTFKLTHEGSEATAVRMHRENYNAHGYDVVFLYRSEVVAGTTGDHVPQILSHFDGDKEDLYLTKSGGADCVLHDFRLAPAHGNRDAIIVVADRPLGESFIDAGPVTFSVFRLRRNAMGIPGRPALYFERSDQRITKAKYCDVGEAFAKEGASFEREE